jgi:transposase
MKMTEKQNRRTYSKEFKRDAVELLLRKEKPTAEIANDLGIRPELLNRWKVEYLASKASSFPGSGHLKDPDAERLRKLERELRIVTEERNILKKACAVFSRTTF